MPWLEAVVGTDLASPTIAQACARAAILFVFGLFCIRVAGRRTFSNLTPLDIIVALVVGSNISRAMTGKAPFIPTLVATFVVVALHRTLAMATRHWSPLAAFLKGRPIVLVHDGVIDFSALRRQGISEDDLCEGLRMEQVASVDDVQCATIERGGKISVVRKADQ